MQSEDTNLDRYEMDSGVLVKCRKQQILRYIKLSKEKDEEIRPTPTPG